MSISVYCTTLVISPVCMGIESDNFQPPNDVTLVKVKKDTLQFNWTSPHPSCPQISYEIESDQDYCELHVNNLQSPSAICRDFSIPVEIFLRIRTVVCGNITSNGSTTISVTARGQC